MVHPRKLRDKVSKEGLYELYWNQSLSTIEIANMFNVSQSSVTKYMREEGVTTRKLTEANSINSHKEVNEDFFDSWNKYVAYVVGVIVTDGNIDDRTGNLRISMVDSDVVEKIAYAMELTNGIRTINHGNGGQDQSLLTICRKKLISDLQVLGVVVNGEKTFKQGALNVPNEFKRHFVRGFFDGDGCLFIKDSVSPKGTPYKRQAVTIVSASSDSLEGIATIMNEDIGLNVSVKKYKGGNKGNYKTMYRIVINDRKKIGKFLTYIYKDKGDLYMERKYSKAKKEGSYMFTEGTL